MSKKFPDFKSDDEADAWLQGADLTAYDLSDMKKVRFELARKDASISLRLPHSGRSPLAARPEQSQGGLDHWMKVLSPPAPNSANGSDTTPIAGGVPRAGQGGASPACRIFWTRFAASPASAWSRWCSGRMHEQHNDAAVLEKEDPDRGAGREMSKRAPEREGARAAPASPARTSRHGPVQSWC